MIPKGPQATVAWIIRAGFARADREHVEEEFREVTTMLTRSLPDSAALLRLPGSVLIEQHDEWETGERRYFSDESMLEPAAMDDPIDVIEDAVILAELAEL